MRVLKPLTTLIAAMSFFALGVMEHFTVERVLQGFSVLPILDAFHSDGYRLAALLTCAGLFALLSFLVLGHRDR
jgi:hypothetical protein